MTAERSPPRRKVEVQRRARRIMEREGVGYGLAMRKAGWMVKKACGNGS